MVNETHTPKFSTAPLSQTASKGADQPQTNPRKPPRSKPDWLLIIVGVLFLLSIVIACLVVVADKF